MRQRLERKLDKQLRRLRHKWPDLVSAMYSRKKQTTLSWGATLSQFVQDTSTGWIFRSTAARVLALADRQTSVSLLLEQFFRQENKFDLWETALSLEYLGERAAVGPLVRALESDPNPDRRNAAARTLGWIPKAGPRGASGLVRALATVRK